MREQRSVIVALLLLLLQAAVPALCQTPPAGPPDLGPPGPPPAKKNLGDRDDRRLFQRFIEDAAVSSGGWAEMQYRYDNLPGGKTHFIGPLVAFKVVRDVEAGLRFGWLNTRPDTGPNGSGLSDLDLYAKYRFPGGRARTAVGALVKIPTADEAKGLGTGERDAELFAAWRADLEAVSITANAGFRFNGDPAAPLPHTNDTLLLGGGVLLPAFPRLTIVIEGSYETNRIHGAAADGRLTLGMQSRGGRGRGGFRGAVAIPLKDGAPDSEFIAGAFLTY